MIIALDSEHLRLKLRFPRNWREGREGPTMSNTEFKDSSEDSEGRANRKSDDSNTANKSKQIWNMEESDDEDVVDRLKIVEETEVGAEANVVTTCDDPTIASDDKNSEDDSRTEPEIRSPSKSTTEDKEYDAETSATVSDSDLHQEPDNASSNGAKTPPAESTRFRSIRTFRPINPKIEPEQDVICLSDNSRKRVDIWNVEQKPQRQHHLQPICISNDNRPSVSSPAISSTSEMSNEIIVEMMQKVSSLYEQLSEQLNELRKQSAERRTSVCEGNAHISSSSPVNKGIEAEALMSDNNNTQKSPQVSAGTDFEETEDREKSPVSFMSQNSHSNDESNQKGTSVASNQASRTPSSRSTPSERAVSPQEGTSPFRMPEGRPTRTTPKSRTAKKTCSQKAAEHLKSKSAASSPEVSTAYEGSCNVRDALLSPTFQRSASANLTAPEGVVQPSQAPVSSSSPRITASNVRTEANANTLTQPMPFNSPKVPMGLQVERMSSPSMRPDVVSLEDHGVAPHHALPIRNDEMLLKTVHADQDAFESVGGKRPNGESVGVKRKYPGGTAAGKKKKSQPTVNGEAPFCEPIFPAEAAQQIVPHYITVPQVSAPQQLSTSASRSVGDRRLMQRSPAVAAQLQRDHYTSRMMVVSSAGPQTSVQGFQQQVNHIEQSSPHGSLRSVPQANSYLNELTIARSLEQNAVIARQQLETARTFQQYEQNQRMLSQQIQSSMLTERSGLIQEICQIPQIVPGLSAAPLSVSQSQQVILPYGEQPPMTSREVTLARPVFAMNQQNPPLQRIQKTVPTATLMRSPTQFLNAPMAEKITFPPPGVEQPITRLLNPAHKPSPEASSQRTIPKKPAQRKGTPPQMHARVPQAYAPKVDCSNRACNSWSIVSLALPTALHLQCNCFPAVSGF